MRGLLAACSAGLIFSGFAVGWATPLGLSQISFGLYVLVDVLSREARQ